MPESVPGITPTRPGRAAAKQPKGTGAPSTTETCNRRTCPDQRGRPMHSRRQQAGRAPARSRHTKFDAKTGSDAMLSMAASMDVSCAGVCLLALLGEVAMVAVLFLLRYERGIPLTCCWLPGLSGFACCAASPLFPYLWPRTVKK